MISHSDILFCNKEEAFAVGQHMSNELEIPDHVERDEQAILSRIASKLANYAKTKRFPGRTVIITRSEQPVIVSRIVLKDGSDIPSLETFTVAVESVSKSKICDSNGCGDTFVGGYLAKLVSFPETSCLRKNQIEAAVKAGNLMAGEVLQRYGC